MAVAGGRIGNLIPAEPGLRGGSRCVLLTRGVDLRPRDGGFELPPGGLKVGEALIFQRGERSLKARVTRIEDEHLFEVETSDEVKAREEAAAAQLAAEAKAAVSGGGAGKEG